MSIVHVTRIRPLSRTSGVAALFGVGLLLGLAGPASAGSGEKVRLTPAGQAAARAAVLVRADVGPAAGWTGGPRKPSPGGATPSCPGFHPKQSDLVLIGDAASSWRRPGLELDSEAQVLRTAQMVRLDWQRTVLAPQALQCMRTTLAKQLGPTTRLVSLRRLAFPQLATFTRAYRAQVSVQTAATAVPVMVDIVLVGRGRTEVTLSTTAPLAAASAIESAEVRLARLLVARIRS